MPPSSRRWTRLVLALPFCLVVACPEPEAPAPGEPEAEVPVGHQGAKAGTAVGGTGPLKDGGSVVFPGSGRMPEAGQITPTEVEPGEVAPSPSGDRPARLEPASAESYVRFFVTLTDGDTVGLASEAITLPGTLAGAAYPAGTLLVVASGSSGDLGVGSFVDGRTERAMHRGDPEDEHTEQAVTQVVLPFSAPTGTTRVTVWEYSPGAVPWDTPLTVANLPALTAPATELGSVEYKP